MSGQTVPSYPQTMYAQPYVSEPKEKSCAMAVIGVIVAVIVVVAIIIIVVQNVNRSAQLKQIEENTKKTAAMRAARVAQEATQRQQHAVRMGAAQQQHQSAHDTAAHQHSLKMAAAAHQQKQQMAMLHAQQQQQMAAHRQAAAARVAHPHHQQLAVAAGPRLLTAEEAATLPAPFPSTQLNTPNTFEDTVETNLGKMPTAMGGIAPGNAMGTHQSQTSESPFSDVAYQQDPSTLTPQSAADMTGLNAYLPNEAGATEDGRDPQTGLPIFTPNKLRRSNMLGSYGKEGFLRQVQDPLTGYRKSVGKWYCSSNQLTNDLNVRRRQFNAERAAGNDDPVLFNSSDWAYF